MALRMLFFTQTNTANGSVPSNFEAETMTQTA